MRNDKKMLAAVLVGSMAVAGVTFAKEGGGGRSLPPELLQKYDANKNGTLEDTERVAMKADFMKQRAERMAQYDTNKDGKLDDAERQAAHKARAAERFKELDTNGNGTLSLEEFQAGMGKWGHGRHGGHR
jgi:hypothetical protein